MNFDSPIPIDTALYNYKLLVNTHFNPQGSEPVNLVADKEGRLAVSDREKGNKDDSRLRQAITDTIETIQLESIGDFKKSQAIKEELKACVTSEAALATLKKVAQWAQINTDDFFPFEIEEKKDVEDLSNPQAVELIKSAEAEWDIFLSSHDEKHLATTAQYLSQAASMGHYGPIPAFVTDSAYPKESLELYAMLCWNEEAACSKNRLNRNERNNPKYQENLALWHSGQIRRGASPLLHYLNHQSLANKEKFVVIIKEILEGERLLQIHQANLDDDKGERKPLNFQRYDLLVWSLLGSKAVDNETNHYFSRVNFDIIGPKGIEIVLKDFNKKNHDFENMPFSVADCFSGYGPNSLEKVIQREINLLSETPGSGRRCVLFSAGVHAVSMIIEKDAENKFYLFNTDTAPLILSKEIWGDLAKGLVASEVPNSEITIFFLKSPIRQYDKVSCPVISIRDVVQFSRKGDQISEYFKETKGKSLRLMLGPDDEDSLALWKLKNFSPEQTGYLCIGLNSCPPELMTVAQELSVIDAQDTVNQTTVQEKLRGKGQVVRQRTEKFDKEVNAKVLFLRRKYQQIILLEVFRTS